MERFVILSGCSGGGKSSLLAELARRGYAVVEEPGRRIVAEELRSGGQALPWVDLAAFARRALSMALADLAAVPAAGSRVFFDRGLIDAAVALSHATGVPLAESLPAGHRFNRLVFFTPPWPEIFAEDRARRHGMDAALAEYERLSQAYPALGYELCLLPRGTVAERADYLLARLPG